MNRSISAMGIDMNKKCLGLLLLSSLHFLSAGDGLITPDMAIHTPPSSPPRLGKPFKATLNSLWNDFHDAYCEYNQPTSSKNSFLLSELKEHGQNFLNYVPEQGEIPSWEQLNNYQALRAFVTHCLSTLP